MKMNFSEPKIYTGAVDISQWSTLSKKQQKESLGKDWYVYYSFRDPKTGKLKRQSQIKAGANRYKDKESRYHILKQMQKALAIVLREGFDPYQENASLIEYLENRLDPQKEKEPALETTLKQVPEQKIRTENVISIADAFSLVLETKERVLSEGSFPQFKSRIERFKKWLASEGFKLKEGIDQIDKKLVIRYLNSVLQSSSARNRNNTRTDLGSLFQTLEDNDVIQHNFVRKINVLRAIPTRHKSYTPELLETIDNHLSENDPVLRLFIQFICYNFLRPVEVCRLKIKDIDVTDKKLYLKAKNQPVKTKIIPDILLKEIPDLTEFDKNDFLFTVDGIGGVWFTSESNKRNFYTKRFKKVKDHFGLGGDYTMYSFRHTFITKLYRELAKNASPFEVKSKLKLITGHSSMKALEQYLRDIDAALPEDYSKLLE
ncbi:tyrosine-type recombinase/integrase [Kriegella aquimaris]|nr:tyrosine-type recombinase/integrase [Kriegella aquimaris]